ncbi:MULTISPECIES: hypothetical protein [unclassified Arsukibacterium]|mgnify:CR=1 FL=1|uniref:hypothetical protein n=1 Tax=unclassified Arsukibacterium TaxID=2635278 RepID=UPI000C476496|nr:MULTISPECIES: hypothetical protein [unclassified Arsukibacterium]MAA95587.1 hypothetical protein [Rheinheimera sp.]MBM33849.1 hypothetical protein [Rheinheimera sp.]HAW93248.1 hypothetical protein [Candidatus Azambacteria bacterium]
MEQTTASFTQTGLVLAAFALISAVLSYLFVAKILIPKGMAKTKAIIIGKAGTMLLFMLASFFYLYFRYS